MTRLAGLLLLPSADAARRLGVAATVAFVGAAVALLLARLWQRLVAARGRTPDTSGRKADGKAAAGWDVMGPIEPLHLDWQATVPERIYKFADKYNLTMGLRKTTINTITRLDQQYVERIAERRKILAQYPGALGCLPTAEPMVRELYAFLVAHYLPRRYPQYFVLAADGRTLHNRILDEHLPTAPPAGAIGAALRTIALTVDEDFLMLLPSGETFQLQAFVWLYPVGFDPVDKMGLTLREAHRPVPSYAQHLQTSMDRYFGRLQPGRVVDRVNWAVATNSALCERGEYHLYADDQPSSLRPEDIDLDDTWVRCELQTLFALPESGGRILSVHLYLYPVREIKRVGLADAMVRATDGYGQGNAPAFARYKRTPVWGEVVKAYLRSDEDLSEEQVREKRAREGERTEAERREKEEAEKKEEKTETK